jgi:hypothetical protein
MTQSARRRVVLGRPHAYRNRYVRTPLYEHPNQSRYARAFDPHTAQIHFRVTTANTHLIAHAHSTAQPGNACATECCRPSRRRLLRHATQIARVLNPTPPALPAFGKMTSDTSVAWRLADAASPCLTGEERTMIFVQLGCGENHLRPNESSPSWYVKASHCLLGCWAAGLLGC